MLSKIVAAYYAFRQYPMPTSTQALLFLISELGEAADAYMQHIEGKVELPDADAVMLAKMVTLGQSADEVVSAQNNWVRNHDREKAPNLEFEIGDCLMMLCIFAMTLGLDAVQALYNKMYAKKFDVFGAIGQIMTQDLRHQN